MGAACAVASAKNTAGAKYVTTTMTMAVTLRHSAGRAVFRSSAHAKRALSLAAVRCIARRRMSFPVVRMVSVSCLFFLTGSYRTAANLQPKPPKHCQEGSPMVFLQRPAKNMLDR
jgi:hypothetical protein